MPEGFDPDPLAAEFVALACEREHAERFGHDYEAAYEQE